MKRVIRKANSVWPALVLLLFVNSLVSFAQRRPAKAQTPPPPTELSKLRDEYIKATKDYKGSLERLLLIYQENVKRAEEKLDNARKLFADGLVARSQIEEDERALAMENSRVSETQRQMAAADTQIAEVLVESEADEVLARNLKLAKSKLVRTTSFTRFSGNSGWNLGDAWKVQRFFSETFHKDLPIAVFGQGAIHERWHLDHRNAMDIQLHPDGPEGQALINFLEKNGIPFSAFRSAIPGTATGPHIHIGRPSHRY